MGSLSNYLILTFVVMFGIFLAFSFMMQSTSETGQHFNSTKLSQFSAKYNESLVNITATANLTKNKLSNNNDSSQFSYYIMGFTALYENGIQMFQFATFIPDLFGSVVDLFGEVFQATALIEMIKFFFTWIILIFVLFAIINFFRGGGIL